MQSWCIIGAKLVHSWCKVGAFLVQSWCKISVLGGKLVHSWCKVGAKLVFSVESWCILGAKLVHSWCKVGAFVGVESSPAGQTVPDLSSLCILFFTSDFFSPKNLSEEGQKSLLFQDH